MSLAMDLLADENVETEWIQALDDNGHDIIRVVDVDELGASAADRDVLMVATERDRVLLTADQADFSAPPTDDHAGIIIIATGTRTGSEVRRAVRRIERAVPDLSGHVALVVIRTRQYVFCARRGAPGARGERRSMTSPPSRGD